MSRGNGSVIGVTNTPTPLSASGVWSLPSVYLAVKDQIWPGSKGKRLALPNSRVLLHQPSGGAEGQSVDIEIQAREILRMRDMLDTILAEKTGQSVERIRKDTDRDFILSAQEALEYGLIDSIIASRKTAPPAIAAVS